MGQQSVKITRDVVKSPNRGFGSCKKNLFKSKIWPVGNFERKGWSKSSERGFGLSKNRLLELARDLGSCKNNLLKLAENMTYVLCPCG